MNQYYWQEYGGVYYLYFRTEDMKTAGGDPTWITRTFDSRYELMVEAMALQSAGYVNIL